METNNCTEYANEKQSRELPPSFRDIIDQNRFVNLQPDSKAFRERLYESQIFANFIEHENRVKFLMDFQNKGEPELNDVTFFEFMKIMSEFQNYKPKAFEKEWDSMQTNLIDTRLISFEKVVYDLTQLK